MWLGALLLEALVIDTQLRTKPLTRFSRIPGVAPPGSGFIPLANGFAA